MHDDSFKIYVDQLREGQEKIIHESFSPDFLDIHERDLAFTKPVNVKGKAYIAEDELILQWTIDAKALIPCSICNQQVEVPIQLNQLYYAEPLANIKGGIFNFKEALRETILLEIPSFVECKGSCPQRQELGKYLKPSTDDRSDEEGYQPFADLDWKP
jgi:uncharacterized metal-binding protein YceD (DUF177 family)